MRLPTILFATALCTLPVTPVFPQFAGGSSCTGSADGATTIHFTPSLPIWMAPVTGSPYSAIRSGQSVQTLADGTQGTRRDRVESAAWRDSAGRVRTEIRVLPGEPARPCESSVKIEDPVAGYVYLLDSVDQVAYRLPLTTLPTPVSRPAATSPGEPAVTAESLGEKTMFGITVTGTRTTTTYPAGSGTGNDRPVTTTSEHWESPQLQINVYSQSTSPQGTVTTITLKNLSVAEPDPSLLQVPPGYKIVDETGPFTITIPAHN